ncbi:MAG: hypothetical protein Q8L88_08970 [Bacteroidota bacterium]|nr:hypothetical protein [Bacteroidota bacterium]
MKSNSISRTQRYESGSNIIAPFTEQELMRIVEVHQMQSQIDQNSNVVSQIDIDKLFE